MAKEFKKEEKPPPSPNSFEALITKELFKFVATIMDKNPDAKNNMGRMIGNAFVWDTIWGIAEKMSNADWKDFASQKIIPDKESLDPGFHQLVDSPHFAIVAKVSNPVQRFNADKLAEDLNKSKYKVPLPVAKMMVENARQPTKSSVTLSVAEKVSS